MNTTDIKEVMKFIEKQRSLNNELINLIDAFLMETLMKQMYETYPDVFRNVAFELTGLYE